MRRRVFIVLQPAMAAMRRSDRRRPSRACSRRSSRSRRSPICSRSKDDYRDYTNCAQRRRLYRQRPAHRGRLASARTPPGSPAPVLLFHGDRDRNVRRRPVAADGRGAARRRQAERADRLPRPRARPRRFQRAHPHAAGNPRLPRDRARRQLGCAPAWPGPRPGLHCWRRWRAPPGRPRSRLAIRR